MRSLRNFRPDRCYRLISRIAHRAFFLTEEERTRFVDRLRRVAGFSGIDVLAYCIMSNHFHILVYVPESRPLDDAELFERIRMLYSGDRLKKLTREWELCTKVNDVFHLELFRKRLLEKGSNKVAFDLLRMLANGPNRPADLRQALGISSANFFTARYLTPLAKMGYIAVADGDSRNSPQRKYVLQAKGRKVLI